MLINDREESNANLINLMLCLIFFQESKNILQKWKLSLWKVYKIQLQTFS